ncbi:unnamed protein product [Ranitomeya imitator]|uniref:YEATS domain-containing protein n=1 Tax=Ranitomeya imitator TaxID=111125 RepID=A0ABN9MGD2_9NEOB|nr:unnamed protein product [Ranitomeya imitator]
MFKRMAEFGPDSGGRVKGVTIVKPIVYGNVARYFGKKREEDGHTHQWTVYVKPYRNEDMSAYVKKIQFKLHESYGNPLRDTVWTEKHTYARYDRASQVKTQLWRRHSGACSRTAIHGAARSALECRHQSWVFTCERDSAVSRVTLYHLLKLFQSDTNAMLGKKTVVSEFYDEMIFQDPTAMMQQLLTTSRQLTLGAYKHETECPSHTASLGTEAPLKGRMTPGAIGRSGVVDRKKCLHNKGLYDPQRCAHSGSTVVELESKTREKLDAAKKKTSFEISELKERLKASRETINGLKSEIKKLEEDDQSKDM